MDGKPSRRWFRFSLRTLFVVFTVVAAWLGRNVWLVGERRAFLENLPERAVARVHRADDYQLIRSPPPLRTRELIEQSYVNQAIDAAFQWPSKDPLDPRSRRLPFTTYPPTEGSELPWLRRSLGDASIQLIACFPGPGAVRARELFPEAIVMVAEEPWPEWSGSWDRD
jgi:hypothetical protein